MRLFLSLDFILESNDESGRIIGRKLEGNALLSCIVLKYTHRTEERHKI
jgi:hypothetical protein